MAHKLLVLILLMAGTVTAQTARRLVVISVDGLMARTLRNAEKLGARLPNLTEFRDRGAVSAGLTGVFPTVTYPSHTTMMTGRLPAEHGIISNTLFDPERTLNGAWYWYAELIRVPTLWEAAKAKGLTTAAVGWPVTAGARIDFNFPEYRAFRNDDDRLAFRALATPPGMFAEFEKWNGPMKPRVEGHMDDVLSSMAAFLIERHKPHLLLVHLIDLDHDQHAGGPENAEALKTLESIDAAIGKIRKAAATAGVESETAWMVVSDHGFFKVEKALNVEAVLASLGLDAGKGNPKSWRVAARTAGGSAAFVVNDPKDVEAQGLVLRTLRTLKDAGGAGIDRIMEREELARMKAWPDAFAAISMQEGWTVGSERAGAWVTSYPTRRGTHGYAPGPEGLDCTFVVYGAGIEKKELPHGSLVDVAPTASALLGVTMPGRNLLR